MASNSEKTFGSRLFNAEQIAIHLASFVGYIEVTPECKLSEYKNLITQIQNNNNTIASSTSQFSLAVEIRQKLFTKNADSLNKSLSPIASYVKAKFGKTSKHATEVISLVNKIRGEKTNKLKKDEEGEFVSQSARSYGSQTQHFADIISTLTSYGSDYSPSNPKISLAELNAQLTALMDANTGVTTSFGQLKPAKDLRTTQYEDLNQRTQKIKDSVKSQYGLKSTEYKLIKGYKI
jgi:hypothetical protein